MGGLQNNPVIISTTWNWKKTHKKYNHYVLKPEVYRIGLKEAPSQMLQSMNIDSLL